MSTKHLQTPKVQATMQKVGAIMADRLAPLFKSDALVTVIVRFPDNDEADFFMSDRQESIAELRRFLERCDKRDQLDCTDGAGVEFCPRSGEHVMDCAEWCATPTGACRACGALAMTAPPNHVVSALADGVGAVRHEAFSRETPMPSDKTPGG